MKVEVSIGEVADKISILIMKNEKITDRAKLANVQKELFTLIEVFPVEILVDKLYNDLCHVNLQLWYIEDAIREKERLHEFDEEFIKLARDVYFTNDRRASVKKEINLKYGSDIVEEKSYQEY